MDNYYRANYDTGEIHMEEYYNDIGELHRDDGPAVIFYYKNGKIDRVSYYKDGELHRENLPAIIYYNSHEEIMAKHYFKEGKEHREDGPALITYFQNEHFEFYYLDGVEYLDKDIIDNWKKFCKMKIFR